MMNSYEKDAEEIKNQFQGILTKNKFGCMLEFDDPNLVESLSLIDKSKPVGDFGVAFGYSSKRLLKEGFTVYANDLDESMLENLWRDTTDDEKTRLKMVPGDALNLEFEESFFSAVILLRFIHFLKGIEIRSLVEKIYKWLAPGGVLVITAVDSVCLFSKGYGVEFESLNNKEWPGESKIVRNQSLVDRITPDFLNFISVNVLVREVSRAGFSVYKANMLGRKASENFYSKPSTVKENYSSIIAIKDITTFLKRQI